MSWAIFLLQIIIIGENVGTISHYSRTEVSKRKHELAPQTKDINTNSESTYWLDLKM